MWGRESTGSRHDIATSRAGDIVQRPLLLVLAWAASAMACGRGQPLPTEAVPAPTTSVAPQPSSLGSVSSQGPTAPRAPVANVAPSPDFHVIAEGWHGGPELGTQLSLCPLDGAVFACGSNKTVILRGDRFVHDPALEAGLPGDRWITRIVGKWPDSAWLLYADPDTGNWSYAVYRWTKSRWVRVLDVPQGMVGLSVQLVPWKGGALARVTEPGPELTTRPKMRFVPLGTTGALPEIPSALQGSASCTKPIQHIELKATPTGDLIGLTTSCDYRHSYLARWSTGSGRPVVTELPACPDGSNALASRVAIDAGVAAFGSCGVNTAYLARMVGDSPSIVDTTGLDDRIAAHARNGDAEYVVIGNNSPYHRTRLLKRVGSQWNEVALPPSRYAPAKCEGAPPSESPPDDSNPRRIIPTAVWTVGSDTWISGYAARPDCWGGNAGVLLRSSPTSEVLHLP